jgi:hypothetical protein
MDKDRDPSGQVGSKQELHREMERTRQSMSETVDQIKGELSHALDWQTYLRRYPGAFLIGGGALGFIIGRVITGPGFSRHVNNVRVQAATFDGAKDRSPKFSSEDSSIRRVIDMTASALLAQVVPIVSSKVRNLLGIDGDGGAIHLGKTHGVTEF